MSSRIVIDASVALRWFFDDEADVEAARELSDQWGRREVEFIVPSHWPLEILNAIRSRIVRKRIEPGRARELATDFIELAIVTTDITAHHAEIYHTAVELDRSVYDAAYIVLAEKNGIELVTADKKLFNAISAKKPFVRYVADYGRPTGAS